MAEKVRLDVLLVRRGLLESREQAKERILAGEVLVNDVAAEKPGLNVAEDAEIRLQGRTLPYVSRGGLKLEKALQVFPVTLEGKVVMDIGASTGGFTDCMLQNGAVKVYAVDVGTGQLAEKLRADHRVVNLEQTNIRNVTEREVPDILDFFSVDVSFISLTLVLPAAFPLLRENGEAVCLVKPQFEVGKGRVGKKGVVKDPNLHKEVIREIARFACEIGFSVLGVNHSPVRGPEGNIEYLLYLRKETIARNVVETQINEIVRQAHGSLRGMC